jgi:hypothetical protein
LRAEPFATRQATDPFINDRMQRLAPPAIFGQFGSLVRVDFVLLFDFSRASNDHAFLHTYGSYLSWVVSSLKHCFLKPAAICSFLMDRMASARGNRSRQETQKTQLERSEGREVCAIDRILVIHRGLW